jgi:uncharacterized protein (TIGR02231 family)
MNKFFFIILAFSASFVNAQTVVSSKITDVTVYRSNAQIVSEASTQLKAGTTEIVIDNISTAINPSSLQVAVKSKGNVSLLSAKYERNFLQSPDQHPKIKVLKDSLEILDYELRWLRDQKAVYVGMEDLLNKNKSLGGEEGSFKPSDVNILVENYRVKLLEVRQSLMNLDKKEKKTQEQRNKVQSQLTEANAKYNQPMGQIVLQISSLQPTSADFKITYSVYNAGWEPIYDLRSEGTDKPVNLSYKANIYQNTGFEWDRVNLTVSTGNPSQNNDRPILSTQFVDVYVPVQQYKSLETISLQKAPSRAKSEVGNLAYAGEEFDDAFMYDAKVVENQLNVDFVVSLPQSIPSDGKYHLTSLEQYELPSVYKYHSVPKLDKGAFLLAKVSNWGQYNLLPGTANIFFEGAYVGESFINPNQTSDTLLLSMGRDERVQIKRKEIKDFTSTKFIGSNKTQTFTYEIEVRNNKGYAIEIEILDQIPVSRNKQIEVKLENAGGAKIHEESGKLEWLLKLNPGQTQKLTFSFSVKSPKDIVVSGL